MLLSRFFAAILATSLLFVPATGQAFDLGKLFKGKQLEAHHVAVDMGDGIKCCLMPVVEILGDRWPRRSLWSWTRASGSGRANAGSRRCSGQMPAVR